MNKTKLTILSICLPLQIIPTLGCNILNVQAENLSAVINNGICLGNSHYTYSDEYFYFGKDPSDNKFGYLTFMVENANKNLIDQLVSTVALG